MKETITGTVQGEYARRYPSYMYRKLVEEPLTPHEIYAGHVRWGGEYLRWSKAIPYETIQYVELADYSVTIDDHTLYPKAILRVEVWAQPNQYTAARNAVLLREFMISLELFLTKWEDVRDELIREAFGPPGATMNNCNNPPVTDDPQT